MSAGWSSTASAIRLIPMFDPIPNDTGGLRRRAVSGPVISREATEVSWSVNRDRWSASLSTRSIVPCLESIPACSALRLGSERWSFAASI